MSLDQFKDSNLAQIAVNAVADARVHEATPPETPHEYAEELRKYAHRLAKIGARMQKDAQEMIALAREIDS